MTIHKEPKHKCTLSEYQNFLCQSSLAKDSAFKNPSCGYGSFHLQYYLNDELIACSVIDILPGGISSVYFYYEPKFSFLNLGVYSACKEIELTRQFVKEIPEMKYYYLGFYVHTCVKMRYKVIEEMIRILINKYDFRGNIIHRFFFVLRHIPGMQLKNVFRC